MLLKIFFSNKKNSFIEIKIEWIPNIDFISYEYKSIKIEIYINRWESVKLFTCQKAYEVRQFQYKYFINRIIIGERTFNQILDTNDFKRKFTFIVKLLFIFYWEI